MRISLIDKRVDKRKVIFIGPILLAGVFVLSFPFIRRAAARAEAPTLRVYTSNGLKPAMKALIPGIEHSLGDKVSPEFDASKILQQKIQSGEAFDVAILADSSIDELIKQGKIVADTRTPIGRVGIGVGLRAGAPKPDISTPEALKQTLLRVKSIAFDPAGTGASSAHVNEVFERLGIADKIRPKLVDVVAGESQRAVSSGKAEMILTLMPEISSFPDLELVGPLPGDLQAYISFSAGVAANCQDAAAAKKFIQFLASPVAHHIFKSNGVDSR